MADSLRIFDATPGLFPRLADEFGGRLLPVMFNIPTVKVNRHGMD